MDAIDDKIVQQLRTDARISFSELGRRVGLSTNATAARVRRLESAGVILGYRAVLAEDVVPADGLEAYVDVRLDPQTDSDAFGDWAAGAAGVRDAVHVTGAYDYLLRVQVRDTVALDDLLRRVKRTAGASHTQTRLVLRRRR